jgi:hypothetical protein
VAWRIDISGAPRNHPDLIGTLQDIQGNLSDPAFVKSLCVHEAAHKVYWQKIGVPTVPDYNVAILHDEAHDVCLIVYASVVLAGRFCQEGTGVQDVAKAHAAGRAATEILAPGYEAGDVADFENLKCDMAAQNVPPPFDEIWSGALCAVKDDIRALNSPVRREIEAAAADFEIGFRRASEHT